MAKIKKAYIEADFVAVIIVVILLMILWLALSVFNKSVVELEIKKEVINNNLFLVNLLRTPTDEGLLREIIFSDYSQNDFTKTKEHINKILKEAFNKELCWKLYVNNVQVKNNNNCEEAGKTDIGHIDAEITVINENREKPGSLINQIIPSLPISYNHGDLIKSSVTHYYSPTDQDFSSWCSPTAGYCLETIDMVREYYDRVGYDSSYYGYDVQNCLNIHGGWCCIMHNDRGFYEDVNCEGDGLVEVEGGFKMTRYSLCGCGYENILPSREATLDALSHVDKYYDPNTASLKPKHSLACPSKYDGQEMFLDWGEGNPWTGCYVCQDHGAAIIIDNGVVKIDVYAGVGKIASQTYSKETGGQPDVYLGCSENPGSSSSSSSSSSTSSGGNPNPGAKDEIFKPVTIRFES